MKKMKVSQKGLMYTHTSFRTSACVHARTVAINVKGDCVLALISQATHIRSEKFKKGTLPNMARVNQILNVVGNGPQAHSDGPKAHQTPPEGLE